MSRKTRFRYKSRRERLQRDMQNIRIISIFLAIGLTIYLIMERQKIGWALERLWYDLF